MNGSIQQLANELGVDAKMTFMKMMPYAQIHELYEWADCLLHTSLYEGQSMALTEAAASGVLLAGTNVGILHDLGERCGVVVQPGDYHSLANKLLDLRRSQTAWKMKIEEAHQWSVTHDLNWTIRQFSDLLIG